MAEKEYMTILAEKRFDGREIAYTVMCPKKMGKSDIGLCNGCGHKMAFGSEQKEVRSPSGAVAFEPVPAVDCSYPAGMGEEELARFMGLYRGATGQRPKRFPQDPDEFDALIEQTLSYLPKKKC
ncbi:MAG: hypothetical protein QXU82_02430 [Candidatus Aenigmatarchaeota archaeon]